MTARLSHRGRTIGLALVAGLGPALAHPPFGFIPGLVGFGVLLGLLDRCDPARPLRSAFWRAWLAGSAYFLVCTWWVGEAFLVDVEAHGWQAPFAVGLLAAGLGLLWGLAGVVYRAAGVRHAGRVLTFAVAFGVTEWLRGHILSGFPWDLVGEAWRAGGVVSQSAALVGVYGLTVITLAIAATPALWFAADPPAARWRASAAAVGALALMASYGAVRLAQPTPPATGVMLRIVQPDIDQAAKWSPEAFRSIYDTYTRMTAAPSATGKRPQVILWPEGAIPADATDYLADGTWTRSALERALAPGQILLMGAARSVGAGPNAKYYNSLLAFRRDADGLRLIGAYDKHHLVPFGEYMPLDAWMGAIGFKALVHVGDGFTPGPAPRSLSAPGLPRLQPLICYESLFPRLARGDPSRPFWVANLSNDAWFGRTSGPWQHLNLASYRAIEEGVPVVRATPTGVSAVIDDRGRPMAELGLGRQGLIDHNLPGPAAVTLYHYGGDAPFWVVCVLGFGLSAAWRRVTRRSFSAI